MHQVTVLTVVASLLAGPAVAAGFEFTQGLADVLAGEQFCGLSYDQAAIAQFVSSKVAGDDLEFTSSLKGLMFLAEAAQEDMSKSAATAHCTQIARLAKTYGFTS